MDTNQTFIYVAILFYLATILYVGFWFSKTNENAHDFYLGGRKLGPFITAMSAEASDMSSWLLMGLPSVAYFCGIADPFWTALGLGIGTYLNWLLVAHRLRRYSDNLKAITIPEFFARRFHDKSHILIGLSAIIIIVFFVPYVGSGFAAVGKLFSSLFHIDYLTAMIIGAVVIISYTTMGGFLAASTTDLIQSIIMSIALFVVIGFGIECANGWEDIIKNTSIDGYLSLTSTTNISTGKVTSYGLLSIISTMAWGLGYFGMPHILLRFMAINDEKHLSLSRRIATVWVFITMGAAILIGVIGYGISKIGAIDFFKTISDAETLIISISYLLSQHGVIAAFIAGLVLAGILASIMSTADSQLLAASSAVSEDIFKGIFSVKHRNHTTILIARITVIVIAVIGIFIARDPSSSIFKIVSFAWAGFGAAFGPVMLFALFWRRCNKQGAIAGMLVGSAAIFIWKFIIKPIGGVWGIYELLPAFIAASLAIVVVSLITPPPSKKIEEEFDAANNK